MFFIVLNFSKIPHPHIKKNKWLKLSMKSSSIYLIFIIIRKAYSEKKNAFKTRHGKGDIGIIDALFSLGVSYDMQALKFVETLNGME